MTSELEYMHKRNSFQPVRTDDLSEEQNHESLTLLIFLKEKRYVTIKGCKVAVRIKQQENIDPKSATSPKVSAEAVMLTAKIDAFEGRDVTILDTPGAYLRANMDGKVNIVLWGTLYELMVASDTTLYKPFRPYETGQAFL